MYVQYTRLADPVLPYPVCMIHGGGASGVLWAPIALPSYAQCGVNLLQG